MTSKLHIPLVNLEKIKRNESGDEEEKYRNEKQIIVMNG